MILITKATSEYVFVDNRQGWVLSSDPTQERFWNSIQQLLQTWAALPNLRIFNKHLTECFSNCNWNCKHYLHLCMY